MPAATADRFRCLAARSRPLKISCMQRISGPYYSYSASAVVRLAHWHGSVTVLHWASDPITARSESPSVFRPIRTALFQPMLPCHQLAASHASATLTAAQPATCPARLHPRLYSPTRGCRTLGREALRRGCWQSAPALSKRRRNAVANGRGALLHPSISACNAARLQQPMARS
eukprot:COSAG01_NODE_2302_length_7952_cov_8.079078_10_plen_173_part_00